MSPFFGRKAELERLSRFRNKKSASLVVIRGRRRIGKSRLLQEFGKDFPKTYFFSGLPPDPQTGASARVQRAAFAAQLEREMGIRGLSDDNWSDLLWNLGQQVQTGPVLVVFDEINWMGTEDPAFLGELKNAWDLHFKTNPNLILVLSGSVSKWIDKNILSSTGFMGRVSLDMVLEELPLPICQEFWGKKSEHVSPYEKFKVLSVMGGVPRYLEEIDPGLSAEENIRQLAFQKGELLYSEFERIFSDLFSKREAKYKQLVSALVEGCADLKEICRRVGVQKSGVISAYLDDLVETGYLSRDFSWNIKEGKPLTLSTYRLRDNYLRFYLKYIEPNKQKIAMEGAIKPPAWHSIMGLQFENLVSNNRKALYRALRIPADEVLIANPYFQRKTTSHPACQVDFLIQTKFHTLYVCEIKFSTRRIGKSVIEEVERKIKSLAPPKHFSFRPVLVHVNGVTEAVLESEYFANIVDFSDFFQYTPRG